MDWPKALRSRVYSMVAFDAGFHPLQAAGRREQPLLLELQHLVDEARTLLPDAVALRHAHVVEEDLRGVGGTHAELVEPGRERNARPIRRHDDQRLVQVRLALAGVREQAQKIGLGGIGYPHLAAIDHVVVARPSRRAS